MEAREDTGCGQGTKGELEDPNYYFDNHKFTGGMPAGNIKINILPYTKTMDRIYIHGGEGYMVMVMVAAI